MGFPRDGFAHHGNSGGVLSAWAGNSGTDMRVILNELRSVLQDVSASKTPLQATGYQTCSVAEQKASKGHFGI